MSCRRCLEGTRPAGWEKLRTLTDGEILVKLVDYIIKQRESHDCFIAFQCCITLTTILKHDATLKALGVAVTVLDHGTCCIERTHNYVTLLIKKEWSGFGTTDLVILDVNDPTLPKARATTGYSTFTS